MMRCPAHRAEDILGPRTFCAPRSHPSSTHLSTRGQAAGPEGVAKDSRMGREPGGRERSAFDICNWGSEIDLSIKKWLLTKELTDLLQLSPPRTWWSENIVLGKEFPMPQQCAKCQIKFVDTVSRIKRNFLKDYAISRCSPQSTSRTMDKRGDRLSICLTLSITEWLNNNSIVNMYLRAPLVTQW